MSIEARERRNEWRHAARRLSASMVVVGMGIVVSCCSRPLEPSVSRGPPVVLPIRQSHVDKIDLLLMLDNSRSMADKQQILAEAVPLLVTSLINPTCIDKAGVPAQNQPGGPLADCPPGTTREFEPVLDIHIGIITSSLGGHGSDACSAGETLTCLGKPNISNNDAGHLVSRRDACGGQEVGTYQNRKFLAWDPAQKLTPAGEADIGDDVDPGIVPSLRDIVLGAGQVGCGYEAQLESWYRFLIDPQPSKQIVIEKGKAVAKDVDDMLLQQRADFMRPSSLLAIIMLTDENDCSIKEYGQFYFAAQQRRPEDDKEAFHLPRARSVCLTNPNDACCKSCGQDAGECPADEACKAKPTLDDKEDDLNLRCFDQKRRFGIDFLYNVDRYTQGITSLTVENRQGDVVPNPIFTDLNPNDDDSNVRDTGLVLLAGIVGVPWQDIARDPSDLQKGFKDSDELVLKDDDDVSTWDVILGYPREYIQPLDPHMIEQVQPRSGTNPITGDTLAPPGSPNGSDAINGHEWNIPNDDLQYACIFDLPEPRDCSMGLSSCDCGADKDPLNPAGNPLCEPDAVTGKPTLQTRAKAYPGIRELAVLKSVGTQGIVTSICPAQLDDPDTDDYGYRPAIGAIVARIEAALGGQCLSRSLTPDANGQVQCLVLEARNTHGKCSCDPEKARIEVSKDHAPAVASAKAHPNATAAGWDCFCEIEQVTNGDPKTDEDDELTHCQNDVENPPVVGGKNVDGWCYVDATTSPATGNPEIVKSCPETAKRVLRFVGKGNPQPGGTLFIRCSGE